MPENTPSPRPWSAYAARAGRWLVGALALLALALGLLWSAVHFVIVPRIDVFRPWLLEQAQQRSGLNLQMDAIEVSSNGWVPELALRGVRLLDAQGATALALPEVHVAFSSASLLVGEVEQIALQGADLEVDVQIDDHVILFEGVTRPRWSANTDINARCVQVKMTQRD